MLATQHYRTGMEHLGASRLEPACACFDATMRAWPKFRLAHKQKGWALLKLNRVEDAVACLTAALEAEHADAMLSQAGTSVASVRARALALVGEHEDAAEGYEAALALGRAHDKFFGRAAATRWQKSPARLDALLGRATSLIHVDGES